MPVTEGARYRVGAFDFAGNTVVKTEGLRPLFKLKQGDWYSEKRIRDGLREGAGGLRRRRLLRVHRLSRPQADRPAADRRRSTRPAEPTVDVTMQFQEGKQYFVNRITFTGNTTRATTSSAARCASSRAASSTPRRSSTASAASISSATSSSSKRGKGIDVEKTPNEKNKVDVTLKLEEQNRNQLTFGAGVSQFEGFFGQLSFQTANFLGRGESLTLSLQGGSRAQNYQVAFTEPFLFDRNITGGVDLFKRQLHYIGQFTQESTGGNLTFGFPVGRLLAPVH